MKKHLFILTCVAILGISGASFAGVSFLPGEKSSVGASSRGNSLQTNNTRCINEGYRMRVCADGQEPRNPCPYDATYFQNCCSKDYVFTAEECEQAGLRASRNSCGGLYRCQ